MGFTLHTKDTALHFDNDVYDIEVAHRLLMAGVLDKFRLRRVDTGRLVFFGDSLRGDYFVEIHSPPFVDYSIIFDDRIRIYLSRDALMSHQDLLDIIAHKIRVPVESFAIRGRSEYPEENMVILTLAQLGPKDVKHKID